MENSYNIKKNTKYKLINSLMYENDSLFLYE